MIVVFQSSAICESLAANQPGSVGIPESDIQLSS